MRRSVIVALLVLAGCASGQEVQEETQAASADQGEEWIQLFDGSTLNGWTNRGTAEWHVEDGTITVTPGSGQGHLATNETFGDFRLQLEFFAAEGVNSGVYVRAPADEPATVDNAYEVQIFDDGPEWQTGAVIQVQALTEKPNTAGRWNQFDITVVGYHFTVLLNGQKVVDADGPPRLANGVIILGPGRGELRFRNIQIQRLN